MGFSTTNDANSTSFLKIIQPQPHPVEVKSFERTSTTEFTSESDQALHLKVCCDVNVQNLISNNSSGRVARSIDVYFSPRTIEHYRKKASRSAYAELIDFEDRKKPKKNYTKKGSKVDLLKYKDDLKQQSSKQKSARYNDAVANAHAHKINRNATILDDALKVGSISLTNVKNAEILYGRPKKKTRISEISLPVALEKQLEERRILDSNAYSKIYHAAVREGRDPSFLFQDSFMKTSFSLKKAGINTTENKRNNEDK